MASGVIKMVTRWSIMGLPRKGPSVDCRPSLHLPNLSNYLSFVDVSFVIFVD